MGEVLSTREIEILESIIKSFISKTTPVGSRYISRQYDHKISPATIRNVMMDLEEKGYIAQPHTSAGRIPTDKGYRYYVDGLLMVEELSAEEKQQINSQLINVSKDVDSILEKSCQGLSKISNLIGLVLSPKFFNGMLKRIDLFKISENMIMIIIAVDSGLVKTITMEVPSDIPTEKLEETVVILNERLHNLTLQEIHDTIFWRMRDVITGDEELIQQFVDSSDKLFVFENEHIHLGGTKNLMSQPEFADRDRLERILDLIDDQKVLVHMLNEYGLNEKITIMIGGENKKEQMKDCSLITAKYKIGNISGTLGIIGPTRMHYAKMISLVDYLAKQINYLFN